MTASPVGTRATGDPAGVFARSTLTTFKALAGLDWAFSTADTSSGGHDAHPYPAKFPPQVPAQVIAHLSTPGQTVMDPFGGSGTTALVALNEGRSTVSLDANPVAVLLTRAKAHGLTAEEREALRSLARKVEDEPVAACEQGPCPHSTLAPAIPNIDKWFSPLSVHELCHVRFLLQELRGAQRDAAELAIGQTAAKVSFQDSETRYVSVPRVVRSGEALRRYSKELSKVANRLPQAEFARDKVRVLQGDARERGAFAIEDESVDLVVTSPPYPNAYDYHLYHRFRILWTMANPADLRRVEIGSHLRQQTVKDPIADYEKDMDLVIRNCYGLLRPGAWAVFVVGDGKYRGEIYATSDGLANLASAAGFHVAGVIDRPLPESRRSVTSAGRRLKIEQLLFLRKPLAVEVQPPEWSMCDYERVLAIREVEALSRRPGDASRFRSLTFARQVVVGNESFESDQALLENSDGTRRKNSTYASHGIHRYKGKFYPQLGRCLLNLSSEPGSLVVDPFSGSGTVALEATLLGLEFHGIELSPVGVAAGRAKVHVMQSRPGLLEKATTFLSHELARPVRGVDWSQFPEATHDELTSWFAPAVLARLARLLGAIRSIPAHIDDASSAVELAEVCVSDLIRDVSHQEPSDLRIRRRAIPLADAPVEDAFLSRWNIAVQKVRSAQGASRLTLGSAKIVHGDSTDPKNWPEDARGNARPIAAVVTSPPYAAALPYLDTDRLSISAVFGHSKQARSELEDVLVGSREIKNKDVRMWRADLDGVFLRQLLPASTISFLQALQEAVDGDSSAGFRRQQTPAVLTRYFVAMSRVLALTADRLIKGGNAWFVLGDSKTTIAGTTWRIPTTQEIAAIAKHQGLEIEEQIPITVTRDNMRHSRNAITRNTLLHFRK